MKRHRAVRAILSRRIAPLLVALLMPWPTASGLARAETLPPPTLESLLDAEVIAVGRFVPGGGGAVDFEADRFLQGDENRLVEMQWKKRSWVREREGRIEVGSSALPADRITTGGSWPVDATKRAIWFFFVLQPGRIETQPLLLEAGYADLIAGREPNRLFWLLQQLDPDRRRAVMEELVRDPEPLLVDALHRVVERGLPFEACYALDVLAETGLLERERVLEAWEDHRVADDVRGRMALLERIRAGEDAVRVTILGPPTEWGELERLRKRIERSLWHLNSGRIDPLSEAAGEEIVTHHLEEALRIYEPRFRESEESDSTNPTDFLVTGYLRHPRFFALLEEAAGRESLAGRSGALHDVLLAVALQRNPRSLDVILSTLETWKERLGEGERIRIACDTLWIVGGERALEELRELPTPGRFLTGLPCARATLGDEDSIRALIEHLETSPAPRRTDRFHRAPSWFSDPPRLAGCLFPVEAPEVTDVLKKVVRACWPDRTPPPAVWRPDDELLRSRESGSLFSTWGAHPRPTVLAEAARRDPRWLGDLCVGGMASPILIARCEAAAVFRELTGRLFDFDPVAFEAKRAPALGRLAMWWTDHRNETRDEWILSYFREQGIEIDSLDARESIPALVEALGRDRVLHDRAVEALTRITGHPFDRHERMEQERAWIVEWLEARGWIESAESATSPR